MPKYISQDLLDRQIKVTKIVGYGIAVFLGIIYLISRYVFFVDHLMLTILGLFSVVGLINLLVYPLHKNIFVTYQLIILMVFLVAVALACFTGGLTSPIIFVLAVFPVAAFSTSKKQGVIWSVISFLTVFLLFSTHNSMPYSLITSDNALAFSFASIFFVLSVSVMISYLVNRSTFAVHRAYERDSKELRNKSLRLENLTTLLNYSNDLMCIVDLKTLAIDDLNPVFKLHLGFELSEVRRKSLMDFIKQDGNEDLASKISNLNEGSVLEFTCTMLCKDGSEMLFNWVGIAKNGKMHASAREKFVC